MIIGVIAFGLACTFFGAAIYINIAEHPARMLLDDDAALAQWAPSYDRAYVMQSGLAVASAVAGYAATWLLGDLRWSVGATLMLANWPYTLLAILPLNNRLKAMRPSPPEQVRGMLARWNRLHAGRSALSLLAALAYGWALAGPTGLSFQ